MLQQPNICLTYKAYMVRFVPNTVTAYNRDITLSS